MPGGIHNCIVCNESIEKRCSMLINILLFLSCTSILNAATETNSLPGLQSVPDTATSILRITGAFIFVVGLFLIGAWLFKNWRGLVVRDARRNRLKIIEIRHIGSRQALIVVGYDQKRILISASPSGVNLISHLPDEQTQEENESENPAFISILNRITGAR